MSGVSTVGAAGGTSTASATAAAQAQAQAQVQQLGLPPANLAQAASVNTVNAELASNVLGVDPASVSGVYGNSGESGGMFSGLSMLPVLANLTRANASQALALLDIQTPSPTAKGSTGTAAASPPRPAGSAAPDLTAEVSSSGAAIVDPLWGRAA